MLLLLELDNDDDDDDDDDDDRCFAIFVARQDSVTNRKARSALKIPALSVFSSNIEPQNPPNHATSRVSGGREPKYRVDVYLVYFC